MNQLIMRLTKDGIKTVTFYPFSTIIVYMIDRMTEQDAQVASLEQKVDELLLEPYKTAQRYLSLAADESDKKKRKSYVEEALHELLRFVDRSLPEYPLLPIQACLFVGLCFQQLGDLKHANKYYDETEKRLSRTYPNEMQFVMNYYQERNKFNMEQQEFARQNTLYAKKMERHQAEMEAYQQAMEQYGKNLWSFAFVTDEDKKKIADYLTRMVEGQERLQQALARLRGAGVKLPLDLSKKGSSTFDPTLRQDQKDFRGYRPPGQQPNRITTPNRTHSIPSNQPYSASKTFATYSSQHNILSVTEMDVMRLYKIFGIKRDFKTDRTYIARIVSTAGSSDLRYENLRQTRAYTFTAQPPTLPVRLLWILWIMLKDNAPLLKAITLPKAPQKPIMPEAAHEPRQPELLKEMEEFMSSEEGPSKSTFQRLASAVFGVKTELDREVVGFAKQIYPNRQPFTESGTKRDLISSPKK